MSAVEAGLDVGGDPPPFAPDPYEIPFAIPYKRFIAAIWITASVALLFVAIRLYSRFRGRGKIFVDDIFIIFAYALFLVTAALWQWAGRYMYTFLDVQARRSLTDLPDDWEIQLQRLMNVWGVNVIFFYACLAAVKLSVLLFFRRLGYQNNSGVRKMWWPLVAYVLVGLIVTIGCTPWKCFQASTNQVDIFNFIKTCGDPKYQDFVLNTYRVNAALDVSSDFFIILVPVIMIWDLHMPLRKKLAFVGLFSLTLVVMIVAIVRIVKAGKVQNHAMDPTYLFLWSAIEMCIAIIIACLSAFPQLFVSSSRMRSRKKPTYQPSQSFMERRVEAMKSKSKNSDLDPSDGNLIIMMSDNLTTDVAALQAERRDENFGYVSAPESSKSTLALSEIRPIQHQVDGVALQDLERPLSPSGGIIRTREYRIQHYDGMGREV
ncbi:hypothetical protein QBC43DRAFT_310049 [Cladorrhinum sp. PSN259]|nr:hypothetical protein QBC43DRAFT_310049 [Cladorrhinum sp. PSN259]